MQRLLVGHTLLQAGQAHYLMLQGDKVKSGQVLGYVEQLGTFVPIEVGCSLSVSVKHLLAGAQLGQPATALRVLVSCMVVSRDKLSLLPVYAGPPGGRDC